MARERRRGAEKCSEELQAFGNIERFGLILISTTCRGGDKVRGMVEPGDIHISRGGRSGKVCMFVDFRGVIIFSTATGGIHRSFRKWIFLPCEGPTHKSSALSFRLEDVYRSAKLAHGFGIDRLFGINST
jgi:hypothetical protein